MKKKLETLEVISGVMMLVGFVLLVGSVFDEASWIFATAAAIALVVFCLLSTAEWIYDRGQKDASEEESE